jgi:hypothetical protein
MHSWAGLNRQRPKFANQLGAPWSGGVGPCSHKPACAREEKYGRNTQRIFQVASRSNGRTLCTNMLTEYLVCGALSRHRIFRLG